MLEIQSNFVSFSAETNISNTINEFTRCAWTRGRGFKAIVLVVSTMSWSSLRRTKIVSYLPTTVSAFSTGRPNMFCIKFLLLRSKENVNCWQLSARVISWTALSAVTMKLSVRCRWKTWTTRTWTSLSDFVPIHRISLSRWLTATAEA